MTTVVYLEDRRPARAPAKPVPVAEFLKDHARAAGELADDWLFQSVSPEAKRRMLAERGLMVREVEAA